MEQSRQGKRPGARFGHSTVILADGRVLIYGGEDSDGNLQNDLHAFENNECNTIVPDNDPPAPQHLNITQKAIFGMVGWSTLVVGSVAAMSVVMFLNGDLNGGGVTVLLLLSAFLLIVLFSGWVWQSLIVHRKRIRRD